ncbi:DNA-directed RNA polymerase I subunit 1 [Nymphaea thermarum]|nr:DNA-directed RNA polymerase I subunit 1 [Nymphaea thermarum]
MSMRFKGKDGDRTLVTTRVKDSRKVVGSRSAATKRVQPKVTPWNADRLRKAILNGPYVYPGAVRVEDVQGVTHLDRPITRRAVAKKLCSSSAVSRQHRLEGKVVHRHLQDGDILLVNRQPTLHKPSMMAHVARVLKGEKTLRMHYANCSTYNADFDGDEMNVHFPQDEIARAEAYNIVNANEQYIVPTKGEPIRGLIQDHIASSVLLTKKDTFLTREEYHHLLYSACAMVNQGEISRKCCMIKSERDIHPILPAIWKPYPLWTGKQIITTILNHVTHGMPPFTVENVAKIHDYNIIPKGCQGDANTLHRQCLISKNEFLYGVIDKAQYGKYGLVHMVQELYGENTAGLLLSILSRLFTAFLQMHGFTCGVDDLLLVPEAEVLRTESTNRCESIGESVHSKFLGVEYDQLVKH